ncbi:MAG: hypothetical protein ABSA04_06120 [Desulfobaccales bacterium]|jgi:hypothetical protein
MKNQYFGDVNDFRKYGLLRVLTGNLFIGEQIEYLRKNWSSNQEIRRAGFKEIKKH